MRILDESELIAVRSERGSIKFEGVKFPLSRILRFCTRYSSTRAIVTCAGYAFDSFPYRNKATLLSTFAREIRCGGIARLGR